MHEVAITGLGIVSPLGHSVEEFGRRMFAGESATVGICGGLVARTFPVPVAGLVHRCRLGQPQALAGLDPGVTPLSWRLTGLATEQAIAGLTSDLEIDAVVYGSEPRTTFEQMKKALAAFDEDVYDWNAGVAESNLEIIRQVLVHHGNPRLPDHRLIAISNACVSSNQAIGVALQRIRLGKWKRAIVGGVNTSCEEAAFMNFHMLSALTVARGVAPSAASRPFSKDRSGFVMAEGAATLILESAEEARRRSAPILGWVRGYGSTADAYRLTDGRPDGGSSARAMQMAIESSGYSQTTISAISAHGTSTRLNDRLETIAIKRVFGEGAYQIPVVGLKSQIGHSIGASAAQAAVACVLMLRQQQLAPTINYTQPDPECDLDYVPNQSRPAKLERILSNSFGFGGQNTCVMFERSAA
jgi:3-oxoacyl-[acyl-carrier-protein] synthase II